MNFALTFTACKETTGISRSMEAVRARLSRTDLLAAFSAEEDDAPKAIQGLEAIIGVGMVNSTATAMAIG